MNQEQKLSAGITNVVRIGNTVHRTPGKWTVSVHTLLNYLHEHGFSAVPKVLGFDKDGREVLSYIEGAVSNYPLTAAARSKQALISAAKLLRAYHDATIDFVFKYKGSWQLKDHPPIEVLCHGDYAPYNLVMKDNIIVGIIDFDTAHPGSRIWDVAYAVYRYAPLTAPHNNDGFGTLEDQAERMKIFCDSYDLKERDQLICTVIERLEALVKFMYERAGVGEKAYQQCIKEGHDKIYLDDIEYIKVHSNFFLENISNSLI